MSGQENYRISVLSAGRGETVELVLGYIAEEFARRKAQKRSDPKKSLTEDLEVVFNLDGQEGIFLEEGVRRTSLKPVRFKRGEDGRVCFCVLPIRRGESDKRLKSFAVNLVATYFVKGFNHTAVVKGEKQKIFWPYGLGRNSEAAARRKAKEKERKERKKKEARLERIDVLPQGAWGALQR